MTMTTAPECTHGQHASYCLDCMEEVGWGRPIKPAKYDAFDYTQPNAIDAYIEHTLWGRKRLLATIDLLLDLVATLPTGQVWRPLGTNKTLGLGEAVYGHRIEVNDTDYQYLQLALRFMEGAGQIQISRSTSSNGSGPEQVFDGLRIA